MYVMIFSQKIKTAHYFISEETNLILKDEVYHLIGEQGLVQKLEKSLKKWVPKEENYKGERRFGYRLASSANFLQKAFQHHKKNQHCQIILDLYIACLYCLPTFTHFQNQNMRLCKEKLMWFMPVQFSKENIFTDFHSLQNSGHTQSSLKRVSLQYCS